MPRPLRTDIADIVYHVINRANARLQIFSSSADYSQFEEVLADAREKTDMRLFAYCIMPNHWHLLVQPRNDGDLSIFVRLLTMTHTQRWHVSHNTVGIGHLYQGRYKSFPVQTDEYFLTAIRYIERNPLRARLVSLAQDWQWGSLWRREKGLPQHKTILDEWVTKIPIHYLEWVNKPEPDETLLQIRTCVNRGQPFGNSVWKERGVKEWGLGSTFRSDGRPRKNGS